MAGHYDRAMAERYEGEIGHGIDDEERPAWERDVRPLLAIPPGDDTTVLDAGAGTGVLSRLLAGWGYRVIGADVSAPMIERARALVPPHLAARLDYRLVDTQEDADAFPPGSFDLVASRQVVCHLTDPLRAFANWHRWLRPGGRVVAIDGLWSCEGWSGTFRDDIDHCPLSCVQTRRTLPYLLEVAGFAVERCDWLDGVNAYLRQRYNVRSPRYVAVARKP